MSVKSRKDKQLSIFLFCLVLVYVVLLIRRIKSDYSGALFWDEWDARLALDVPIDKVNWQLLWQQHNEHRIVFSKILFYLDFAFFNGSNVPLIAVNVILAIFIVLVLFKILSMNQTNTQLKHLQIYCASIFSFSILQIENFSWGFQSQFFLSLLFPLISFSFYILYLENSNRRYFYFSYLFIIFSMGTMASGNFAIITILLISIFLRRNNKEVLLHLLMSVFVFGIYLINYSSSNSSPISTLVQHPDFILKYVFTYFTNPFYQLTGIQAQIFMTVGILVTMFFLLKKIFQIYMYKQYNVSVLVGLMLLTYSLLVAGVSAGGRYNSGVHQATSSRYTTISLMGWFGVLLIMTNRKNITNIANKAAWIKISTISTIIFFQFQFLNSPSVNDVKKDRDFAAIVLLQDIQDESVSQALYPDSLKLKTLSNSLIVDEKSIFNSKFKERYGSVEPLVSDYIETPNCLGYVDNVRPTSDLRGFIVTGWVTLPGIDFMDLDLIAIDGENQVIGSGITGFTRDDVAKQIGSWASKSGFKLVSKDVPLQIFAIQSAKVKCELKFEVN